MELGDLVRSEKFEEAQPCLMLGPHGEGLSQPPPQAAPSTLLPTPSMDICSGQWRA